MTRRTKIEQEATAAAQAAVEAARTPAPEVVPEKEAPQEEPTNLVPPLKVKRGNQDREAMLAEIRKSRGEPEEEKIEPEAKEEPKVEKAPEVVAEPEPKEEPKVEEQSIAAPEAHKTVRVKVDGEEFDASLEEVEAYGGVRAYQIAKAGENRLKKTNELVAQLQRTLAEAPKQPVVPQQTDKEFIASKLDVVRFGAPEEAAAALSEILERGKQKQADPQQIVNQATLVIENKRAVEEFKKEFSDVVSNPLLNKLAIALEREYMAKLPPNQYVDWGNFYRKIGNEIRSAVPRQSQPQPTPAASTPSSDKQARKENIVNLPTASSRAELPKEEKPETREEALNRMRKARGQQQL